jgi:hypothetical protein
MQNVQIFLKGEYKSDVLFPFFARFWDAYWGRWGMRMLYTAEFA